jgi:hypothetical protein
MIALGYHPGNPTLILRLGGNAPRRLVEIFFVFALMGSHAGAGRDFDRRSPAGPAFERRLGLDYFVMALAPSVGGCSSGGYLRDRRPVYNCDGIRSTWFFRKNRPVLLV